MTARTGRRARLDHRHRRDHGDRDRAAGVPRRPPRGASPVKRIDRFDPSPFRSQVAAQVDDFEPLDHMDARAARALDRFSQFGLATGRMAMADAGLVPGVGGAADGERIGIYLGSALGGIAFAETQHEKYLDARPAVGLPHPRARGVRRRGPGEPRHRARRPRADPLDGQLVRVGRRRDRRGAQRDPDGEIDAAIAGGVECPLSPLAFGAFDLIRALGHGFNDDPVHAVAADGRRPRRVRHGRGRGAARHRGGGRRAVARRAHPTPRCSATPRRRTPTTWSSRVPTVGRRPAPSRSRSRTPASPPARSTGSAPTRPPRRSATSRRPGRSPPPSATARRPSP